MLGFCLGEEMHQCADVDLSIAGWCRAAVHTPVLYSMALTGFSCGEEKKTRKKICLLWKVKGLVFLHLNITLRNTLITDLPEEVCGIWKTQPCLTGSFLLWISTATEWMDEVSSSRLALWRTAFSHTKTIQSHEFWLQELMLNFG